MNEASKPESERNSVMKWTARSEMSERANDQRSVVEVVVQWPGASGGLESRPISLQLCSTGDRAKDSLCIAFIGETSMRLDVNYVRPVILAKKGTRRYPINPFDIRKASWVWMTNIGRVYRTNLWHTTAVREFFRLFLENLREFSNENYIANVSTIKHQNLIFVTTLRGRFWRNLCFFPLTDWMTGSARVAS